MARLESISFMAGSGQVSLGHVCGGAGSPEYDKDEDRPIS